MSKSVLNKDIFVGDMPVYHAYPDNTNQKHPGLIVIHEIWGLNDHTRDVANRFAAQGYSVMAPNLFHGMSFEGTVDHTILAEMADPEKRDEAQKKMRAIMAPIQAPEFAEKTIASLKACVDYLLADAHVNDQVAGGIGVLGFCFGGTYAFHLAAHDSRVKACVPFYGHPPKVEEIPNIACPILAFYGDQDANLMTTLPQMKEDMEKAGKDFQTIVYPDTGHAFFNDTNTRMYNAAAAADAWDKTLGFLKKNL